MDKKIMKLELLMLKLEIQNTFFITWWMLMPFFDLLLDSKNTDSFSGLVLLFLPLYFLLVLFVYWIFWMIFRAFSKRKKKIAIYMSFVLDVLFIVVFWYFAPLYVSGYRWLIVSNHIFLLLHVLGTIKIMNNLKKCEEKQELEKNDKKALLNSLVLFMDLNIIIGAILLMLLSIGGYNDIRIFLYAFCRMIVIIIGLLTVITTIKEKESFGIFNVIFGTLNIIFTFNIIEIFLGIRH